MQLHSPEVGLSVFRRTQLRSMRQAVSLPGCAEWEYLMKKVEAIVKHFKTEEIKQALTELVFPG